MRFPKDKRVVLKGKAYQELRMELFNRAGGFCEHCDTWTGLHNGHAHHNKGRGMGGGKRVDSLETMSWLCPNCHNDIHSPKVVPPKVRRTETRQLVRSDPRPRPPLSGETHSK